MTPDELKLAAEFHRGYEAGKAARNADEWQLDRERAEVVRGLRDYDPCVGAKPTDEASRLIRCITGNDDSHVACANDLEETRDRLIHLLGGDQSHFLVRLRLENETGNGTENGTCPNVVPTSSITDELRKFAETFCYEWYDEKDGSVCYTTSDMPPTIDSINGTDYINAIADRIDAKHAELRRKLEAVKGIVDGS